MLRVGLERKAIALGLVLGFAAAPALANLPDPNGCHDHRSCDGEDDHGSGGVGPIPVTVTFDDLAGDRLGGRHAVMFHGLYLMPSKITVEAL